MSASLHLFYKILCKIYYDLFELPEAFVAG